MDTGTMSAINRRDARLIAEHFDRNDLEWGNQESWAELKWADIILSDTAHADRAWLVGAMAAMTPGLYFDGEPAGCDWEDLYSHLRAEILARRAPQPPSVRAPEMTVRAGVV